MLQRGYTGRSEEDQSFIGIIHNKYHLDSLYIFRQSLHIR